ncbi:MAG: UbiA family prenyltransferase [Ardenticatenaceae bacterium]|nr:UbiA family prenyltransferase [Ardenticatenaceae bacterium]
MTSARLLGLGYDVHVHALVFALALLFYNRDRLADSSEPDDQLNMAERAQWVVAHRRALRLLVGAAAAASALLLAQRPAALAPILAGLGFALAYSARRLPGGRAPKQLPGLKTPYVAALWTLLIVGVPLAGAGRPWDRQALLGASAIFALVAAQVTVNDIRDLEGDRLVGTRTLAVLWGERGARLAAILCALLAAAAALALRSRGLVLAAAYTTAYAAAYRRPADSAFRWLIEGAGIATWLTAVAAT